MYIVSPQRIRFQHIWDGIERMPSCSSLFTMKDEFVSQFRATFEVEQDCQDGDEQEVIVSTAIKQRQSSVSVRFFFSLSVRRRRGFH